MKKEYYIFIVFFVLMGFGSCNNYDANIAADNLDPNKKLIEISYDIKTNRDFEIAFSGLTELELSYLNPSEEKQHVSMTIMQSGQVNLTSTVLEFEKKIVLKNENLPDNTPPIVRTEIIDGNVSFYGKDGALIRSEKIDVPNQKDLVTKILEAGSKFTAVEINKTIATMQGQQFIDNLTEFTRTIAQNGGTVLEQGSYFVTIRMPFASVDTRLQGATVLLIDKTQNRMVGLRNYDANNVLLQSVFFGYEKGEVKSLNAIRVQEKIAISPEKTVDMITNSKIENLVFKINL